MPLLHLIYYWYNAASDVARTALYLNSVMLLNPFAPVHGGTHHTTTTHSTALDTSSVLELSSNSL